MVFRKKFKKSISLVVEYLLITLVGVSLLAVAKTSLDSLFKKIKQRETIKEFKDFCIDFNFYLKNLDVKGFYYFPLKVEFKGNVVYLSQDNNFFCKLDFNVCEKTVFGERIVYYDEKNEEFCFE
jgi:hypothetical protein